MKLILMFFQTCFGHECFVTYRTLERVLPQVAALVGDQVSLPAKTQATLRALVRSLSCVNPLVNFQHTMLTESLPTVSAFKWLLLRVDFRSSCRFLGFILLLCGNFLVYAHMSSEETGTPKPLETYRAVVWPHSCVNFQMFLQVSWGVKAFTAHKAQERPLPCVRFNMYN